MKEKMKKILAAKQAQLENLRSSLIESDSKEERAAIGETMKKLADEIAECESILAEMDEPAGGDGAGEGARMATAGAQNYRNAGGAGNEAHGADSKEYRAAYLRKLMGRELSDTEKRDLASANSVVPVMTQNAIITKIKEIVPLLNEVTLLNVAGNVTFAVEGTVADAALHAENAQIASASDTLVTVTLGGYEIVKLLRISATVKTMSIDAFENWLSEMLARKVAEQVENYIVNGNGTSQPKGIASGATYSSGSGNLVNWTTAPTFANITAIIAALPSRFARGAKFLMNRKTFWASVMPIRDDGKAPIVRGEGAGAYNIMGYPVILSDFVEADALYFGDLKMVVANLADDIKVDSSEASGFAYNAIDYRGTAIFDCDIADATAFVKGTKAAG